MSDSSKAHVATADAVTLLLHNQHALAAALEEIINWFAESGADVIVENAKTAMETLDTNSKAIADAIMRIRNA
jgi:hypothetical protein